MTIVSESQSIKFESSRFGSLEVPVDSVITFDHGIIGFSRYKKFVMLDYREPFSWLHSVEEPSLAFVVIDGAAFGVNYDSAIAFSDPSCEFREDDEYAVLLVVTFRSPREDSSVNTKAPLFVNIRNRKGIQAIYDSPEYATRWPLWTEKTTNDNNTTVNDPAEEAESLK
jgi:flagellar assembly factor FliW